MRDRGPDAGRAHHVPVEVRANCSPFPLACQLFKRLAMKLAEANESVARFKDRPDVVDLTFERLQRVYPWNF